ncbi:MAG: hypothetical protein LBG96_10940 [Tannerella sp.]|jgi:hypothetical protein|nr:hypothetical protein [Tannerella sp.]
MANNKYREYFDIDEDYFPQVNDSAIAAAKPDFWTHTYPHQTFIDMLTNMERVLARQDMRTLWIEGAYGTGKSQCAYALKKILEVSEGELRAYWNKYDPLKNKTDLLEKLAGHKKKDNGIVTAHRYASGGISSPRELFMAVQDTLKSSLVDTGLYIGENTLKDSVIAWIDKPANKRWLDEVLIQPEYSARFPQSNSDEVLESLKKGGDLKQLMGNLFYLADKEGVTALNIDSDRLITWIKDVIDKNKIKVVFIWDEFSDYFKNNRESLSEFQKLVELVSEKPFYFIVVTHESGQLFVTADTTWSKVRDRFISVPISLPDNIAFELIGHAFNVKQVAKDAWNLRADDLNNWVNASHAAVMKAAKIVKPQVMKNIIPLHPMAALLLKNIASAFQSNQRSMFNFIKSPDIDNVEAFQWFIENYGPEDEHPFLTIDMLWNFFYEKGRNNLTPDIRLILDTYPQQQDLREDEKTVLKAVLIMQAIDQRLGGVVDLFKATEQNIGYAFEGINSLEGTKSASIAKQLKEKGILVTNPISGGRQVYAAAVLAGDQIKIDAFKKEVRQSSTIQKLVSEGELTNVLSLSPALRLRFESEPGTGKITPVNLADFDRTINMLREKEEGWNFYAVIAFAKNDDEAVALRKKIKTAVADEQYNNIVFIDALATPLGAELLDQYVDFQAMSMYYQGNNNPSSRENADKAKQILSHEWKNRIYNGQFIVYHSTNKEGEKYPGGQGVSAILQTVVLNRFPMLRDFDFARGLSENQLKLTQGKAAAKCGITQSTSGVMVNVEKYVLPAVWKMDNYWRNSVYAPLAISRMKVEIDKLIEDAFTREGGGQIPIGDICDYLETRYGFAPCNLTAFITGFLLKEYSGEPYRYIDSNGGHDPMTQDKLAEMIGNYLGKAPKPKPTYIVQMTPEEKAFYELTEKAWGITPNSCTSADQAAHAVVAKMRELGLPVWCLEEVDTSIVFDIVQKYAELVQKEGNEAHKKAVEIGKIACVKSSLAENMASLLTTQNCKEGMQGFLRSFEGGKVLALAKEIGAEGNVISDIHSRFEVAYACLWNRETGEDEIRKLLTEYGIVREGNGILNETAHSYQEASRTWRDHLKFMGISYEILKAKYTGFTKTFDILLKIYQQADVLPDQKNSFLYELQEHGTKIKELFTNDRRVFTEVYAPYLEGLSDDEIAQVKSKVQTGIFEQSKTDCNVKVKETAEEFRKNQLKSQLASLWKEKTGTKNPQEWSSRYRTPVLCCVNEAEFEKAKKAFETLNRNWGASDTEIKEAIDYLKKTSLFTVLSDEKKRNEAFVKDIIGEYRILLPNPDDVRDKLELLTVDTYEWRDNPGVKSKVRQLAEAEYNAGGSKKVLKKIDGMDDTKVKQYLKKLITESISVGIEILSDTGGK